MSICSVYIARCGQLVQTSLVLFFPTCMSYVYLNASTDKWCIGNASIIYNLPRKSNPFLFYLTRW